MSEFTTFLTTIAAISATIVAILGGFVFSRYIAISNERRASQKSVEQMGRELVKYKSKKKECESTNKVITALSFIRQNRTYIIHQPEKKLNELFFENESKFPSLSFTEMSMYWDKALDVRNTFNSISGEEIKKINSDHVPLKMEKKYAKDGFCYQICREISDAMIFLNDPEYYVRFLEKSNNAVFDISYESLCHENISKIENFSSIIENLELQIDLKRTDINSAKKPEGIIGAVTIFAAIALFCIILPLVLTLCDIENSGICHGIEIALVVFLSAGIIAIFIYLFCLFFRKKSSKEDAKSSASMSQDD